MTLTFVSLTLFSLTLCSMLQFSFSQGIINCEKSHFNATWADVPPYTFQRPGSRDVQGSIYTLATAIVQTCCGTGVTLNLVTKQKSQRSLEEDMGDTVDMALPVVKTPLLLNHGTIDGYRFIPLMETTGGVMLVQKESLEGNPIFTSLLGCWPLAVIVVISAFTAGVIIWTLDQYWNPGHFPKSFLKGAWEGIWWAFVTMTTVGYGDKTPKSVPARVFGLIWMFVGIVVMTIFTATLTSALTSSQDVELEIKGASVGVKRGTIEQITASRSGASVTMFDKFSDMMESLENRTLDGAMVDINFALYVIEEIESRSIKFGPDIKYDAVFGIMLQNQQEKVVQCFAKYASKSQFDVYDALLSHLGSYEAKQREAAKESTNNAMSDLNWIILGLGVVLVVLCCACLAWEFLYARPRRKIARATGDGDKTEPKHCNFCGCDDNTVDTGLQEDTQTSNETEAHQNNPVEKKPSSDQDQSLNITEVM